MISGRCLSHLYKAVQAHFQVPKQGWGRGKGTFKSHPLVLGCYSWTSLSWATSLPSPAQGFLSVSKPSWNGDFIQKPSVIINCWSSRKTTHAYFLLDVFTLKLSATCVYNQWLPASTKLYSKVGPASSSLLATMKHPCLTIEVLGSTNRGGWNSPACKCLFSCQFSCS